MKHLNFYKYFSDDVRQVHFWETETRTDLPSAEKIKEEVTKMFPLANVTLIPLPHNFYHINIKFYSPEDNALFCLVIGGI